MSSHNTTNPGIAWALHVHGMGGIMCVLFYIEHQYCRAHASSFFVIVTWFILLTSTQHSKSEGGHLKRPLPQVPCVHTFVVTHALEPGNLRFFHVACALVVEFLGACWHIHHCHPSEILVIVSIITHKPTMLLGLLQWCQFWKTEILWQCHQWHLSL